MELASKNTPENPKISENQERIANKVESVLKQGILPASTLRTLQSDFIPSNDPDDNQKVSVNKINNQNQIDDLLTNSGTGVFSILSERKNDSLTLKEAEKMEEYSEAYKEALKLLEDRMKLCPLTESMKESMRESSKVREDACKLMVESPNSELSKIFQERVSQGLLFVICMPLETYHELGGEDVDDYEKRISSIPPEFIIHILAKNPDDGEEFCYLLKNEVSLSFVKTTICKVDLIMGKCFLKDTQIECPNYDKVLKRILPPIMEDKKNICLLHAMRIS